MSLWVQSWGMKASVELSKDILWFTIVLDLKAIILLDPILVVELSGYSV
jgi:hypothetical protein